MKLHILGAGNPDPSPTRYGSAFVLEIGDACILIDCGPATTWKMARAGLRPTRVGWLLFTHHHFDHNADYPCFLLTRWDQSTERTPVLQVAGPAPTAWITDRLIGEQGAFVHDWRARVEHPVSQRMFTDRGGVLLRPAPRVEVREVDDGDLIAAGAWQARVRRLTHAEPWLLSVGFRIETDTGVVAVVNDAGPDDAMVDLARGADTLVIAAAFDAGYAASHPEVPPMITGTDGAGRVAAAAGVGRAILVHANRRVGEGPEVALAEVRHHYEGEVVLAEEGLVLEL